MSLVPKLGMISFRYFTPRVAVVLCLLSASAGTYGQTASPVAGEAPEINFSVVSVRPSDPRMEAPTLEWTSDGLTERNNPLIILILMAYDLPDASRVKGIPPWVNTERVDVVAKVEDTDAGKFSALDEKGRNRLLQRVLKDRLHLRARIESRDTGVYALRKSNNVKLTPARAGEEVSVKLTGRYVLQATNINLDQLCQAVLSTEAQKYVINDTGITGLYDIHMKWSRMSVAMPEAGTTDFPDIFSAVKEDLGLKLEEATHKEPYLLVDSIDKPTEQ